MSFLHKTQQTCFLLSSAPAATEGGLTTAVFISHWPLGRITHSFMYAAICTCISFCKVQLILLLPSCISSSTFVPDLSSSTGMWSGFCDGLSYYLFCICDLGTQCLVSSALSSNWLQFKQIIQYCPWKTGARLSRWNLRRVISHHFVCFHSQYYVLPDLTQEHA